MSDTQMVERVEVGKTRLIPEFPPIPPPKKITEDDIHIMVQDVIKEAQEQRLTPTANAFVESANATTINRLKKLVPEKARQVLGLSLKKAALTAAGLYILISSGCGNAESPNVNSPSPKEPTPVSAPLPSFASSSEAPTLTSSTPSSNLESQKLPDYEYLSFRDIKVAIDKEGLPVFYTLPDGTKTELNRKELVELRNKAIASGEPEIIAMFPVPEASTSFNRNEEFSREHPVLSKLPKDVLSEEELEKRGIEIIQADNTQLYIRKGAFGKDGQLTGFNNTGRKLTIVLVDGPVVSAYLMNDPKYSEVKNLLTEELQEKESIESYKTENIQSLEQDLQRERQYVDEYGFRNPEVKKKHPIVAGTIESNILLNKLNITLMKNDKYIRGEMALLSSRENGQHVAERYLQGRYAIRSRPDGTERSLVGQLDSTVVFLAVGKTEDRNYNVVYFTPEGKLASFTYLIDSPKVGDERDKSPKSTQTHPNPKDFTIDPSASPDKSKSYAYGRKIPGFNLRHGIEHDIPVQQWIKTGKDPDQNEYRTDVRAMETVRKAREKWEKSGFTDNSGYHFVFSLPEGGYILT